MFESLFFESKFELIALSKNVHEIPLLNSIGQIKVPTCLEKYWIRNLYVYLRKPI